MMLKIACISDTHMHHNKIVMPKCDMIIHAGDFTYRGEDDEVSRFLKWYEKQQADYKILILGNHEVGLSRKPFQEIKQIVNDHGIVLLHNTHFQLGDIKIYGSPYSHRFGSWAYGATEQELDAMYNLIDPDCDIIVTHGPAKGRLDLCPNGSVGSIALSSWIQSVPHKLKLHVTGHIHESRGTAIHKASNYNYLTVNAGICGIPYTDIVVNPITVEI
jgi:Icc-related predicted phosphoesterase